MQKKNSNLYLSFTKKERRGTIFLLLLIIVIMSVPVIYPLFFKEKLLDDEDFGKQMALLQLKDNDTSAHAYTKKFEGSYHNYQKRNDEATNSFETHASFPFDPNTLDEAGWKKLGVRDKTIQTIQHFISKGGKFKGSDDIKKIWGLTEEDVRRLSPYVRIPETVPAAPTPFNNYKKTYEATNQPLSIDVNSADSTEWIKLPGIGSKLSSRIIAFRDKLGGFYNVEQVGETFGLPDSVFQKIKTSLLMVTKKIRQININTASLDELKLHPYIRYTIANAIVQYRTQHGNFAQAEDIRKIMLVTDEIYTRVAPYLTAN